MSISNRAKGFTLIEVLVAIAIFASLSVAAYQVVNQVQRSNELSQARSARLQEIQRGFVYLDSDFRQLALRQFRHEGEEPLTRLMLWQEGLLESEGRGLLFARLGWLNPQNQFPRGEVAKIGYRLQEGKLERLWWRYPDTTVGEEPVALPIFTKVESFDMRFYNGESWANEWQAELTLPLAIEVKIRFEDYDEISRIYLTPAGTLNASSGGSNNNGNSGGNNQGNNQGSAQGGNS
ncbi:type II secretion system minor pseudopilin GspJ [Vibrio sp. SCSIO 43140]|uniref:type II secretion system minor pseudopilin GspJ n=1 Tax=Vibrio sp. SCSIO 43140 TaxID=2819100 RepID=UPI0020762A0C|nr:type II secretion system minor pseudopilin GspJ [Vibrio sp. SCSIO 43140]USD60604.1 type II secretion system minor pseudopilin GspJ [Vibrio sp. SCSIO 43140]